MAQPQSVLWLVKVYHCSQLDTNHFRADTASKVAPTTRIYQLGYNAADVKHGDAC